MQCCTGSQCATAIQDQRLFRRRSPNRDGKTEQGQHGGQFHARHQHKNRPLTLHSWWAAGPRHTRQRRQSSHFACGFWRHSRQLTQREQILPLRGSQAFVDGVRAFFAGEARLGGVEEDAVGIGKQEALFSSQTADECYRFPAKKPSHHTTRRRCTIRIAQFPALRSKWAALSPPSQPACPTQPQPRRRRLPASVASLPPGFSAPCCCGP